VLPIVDLSKERDQSYLCEGIAEELLDALSRLGSLRVASRTSAFALKGQNLDVREISRRLNVRSVLEGAVRASGERLRVSVTLTNVEDGYQSWSVVAHELTHGLIAHTSGLVYDGESGALNESFADVMGSLVKQWRGRQTARRADWLMGRQMMGPAVKARALRTLTARKAFEDDPLLGTDPQPKHYRDRIRIPDPDVAAHLNSGIPNYAFYLVATRLGGHAWTRAGAIWYEAMTTISKRSGFRAAARLTTAIARRRFGQRVGRVVADAWAEVGL
jgi:hypothetical protein